MQLANFFRLTGKVYNIILLEEKLIKPISKLCPVRLYPHTIKWIEYASGVFLINLSEETSALEKETISYQDLLLLIRNRVGFETTDEIKNGGPINIIVPSHERTLYLNYVPK